MRHKLFLIFLICSLSLCACGPSDAASEPAATSDHASLSVTSVETEPPVIEAPDFSMTDGDGNKVSLSEFEGKPVVLNFWASWCPPCKREMPDFEEAYREYGRDVQFLIVNMTDGVQETVDTARAYIEAQGYTFPVYYDTGSEGAYAYGVRSIPTTYFIDAEGVLVTYATGALDAASLERGIGMLLGE